MKAKTISELENEVMQILWSRAAATAEEVQSALAGKRKLKDSTIRTLLRRLEAKGFIQHRTVGRAFLYAPALPRERAAARALRQVKDRLCAGSLEMLLVGMVNERMCTREQLQRLAKKIAAQQKKE